MQLHCIYIAMLLPKNKFQKMFCIILKIVKTVDPEDEESTIFAKSVFIYGPLIASDKFS